MTDTREALRELSEAAQQVRRRCVGGGLSENGQRLLHELDDAIERARSALRDDRGTPVDLSRAKVDELIREAFDKAERNGDGWSDRATFMAGFLYACDAAPIPEDRHD